ncbi:MAG: GGDEF domain-containing protein [Candidatus Accumulibacter sp.]|jgi:diguanylate cyclase|nr:GGDEF domain-containing protein [Accumulibacter sp.]
MATFTNPADIARETLKQMMARRMAPSPDNYRAIYDEIAGVSEKPAEDLLEREIRSLLSQLPKDTPAQQGLARQLDQALRNRDREAYRQPLIHFIREHGGETNLAWRELLADFLQQWEANQSGLTRAKKREALDRVLSVSGRNEILFSRLQNLTRSWAANQPADEDIELVEKVPEPAVSASAPAVSSAPLSRASELLSELREAFVFALENIVAASLEDEPEAAAQAKGFAARARAATTLKAMSALLADIRRFAFSLEFVVEDRHELRAGLLRLLCLMIDNIGELVIDDRWLAGQIEVVRGAVAEPMSLRALNDAEQRLKEVIFKQSHLKHGLMEAKQVMKQLLAVFVDHLAEFTDSTSDYHDKIEGYAEKISRVDDITQLEDVLGEVIRETRLIQFNAQRSRDDLRQTNQRVVEAEQRISQLQDELDKASQMVRHDQLTGALNRRGLDEIFEKELVRSRQRRSPLSVALLDIDNFKKLNDSLGHDAGDAALIHLVSVIRETLRPQDTLARFGGEEFIILLPDTSVENAAKALVRVQRELTRRYFLANNEKLLITFSAGVSQVRPDDTEATVIKRADEAAYGAKTSGKNRVVSI